MFKKKIKKYSILNKYIEIDSAIDIIIDVIENCL